MIDAVTSMIQLVPAGSGAVFENTRICTGRTVRHEAGSTRFVLLAPGIYSVHFNANIAVPTGETVGPISVGLAVDGESVTGTDAIITPTAVEEYGNVSISSLVRVYGCGNCPANIGVTVVNTSDIPINVQDANLIIIRECGGGVA